jgi:uncharacterized protein (DUF1800 family)
MQDVTTQSADAMSRRVGEPLRVLCLSLALAALSACGGGSGQGEASASAAPVAQAGGGGDSKGAAPQQPAASGAAASPSAAASASSPQGPGTINPAPQPAPGASAPSAGGAASSPTTAEPPALPASAAPPAAAVPVDVLDAQRLADQASFGPNETLIAEIRTQGPAPWVKAQQALSASRYSLGNGDAVHRFTGQGGFCDSYADRDLCWRDWFSTEPLVWDFFRNALRQKDQLRQRVAFALAQLVVVNSLDVSGTYGFRNYHNALLDNAFTNYRDVLKKVALSPVMGDFLNNVNNDKAAPNENFARELLQLFSVGTCQLDVGGTLSGNDCKPTYDNATVRAYAYALTGWTFVAGGKTSWGCSPEGANCRHYGGDMIPLERFHDTAERALLGGVKVPAGSTAPQALELVLDSLMTHANTPILVGKHLIQQLVSSNPSPTYVQRVAQAFAAGSFSSGGVQFGSGKRGDLAATVAAVLLDSDARNSRPPRQQGKLREPVLLMTGVLRGLNGRTDGEDMGGWWGETLRQHMFRAPSVFNFYPPDYPVQVPGLESVKLVGPAFGIHNVDSALERLNYLSHQIFFGGSKPNATIPGAIGTQVDLSAFVADAPDAAKLVDRLSIIAMGRPLPDASRTPVVNAVAAVSQANQGAKWQMERVKQAAYLVYAAPQYHVSR